MHMRNTQRGITLIELMIVVVVISILAAVAYPNYQEFVARAKRNEAKAALLQLATNQERFYLNNNRFTADVRELGFSSDDADGNTSITENEYYTIDVTAANASNFTATATYRFGAPESDRCRVFTIDGRGDKTSTPYADCWTRSR